MARAHLEMVSKHMKEWVVDKKRKPLEFQARDKVLIKLRPKQLRLRENKDQRLVWKYDGLADVLQKAGKTSYKVQLHSWMKIHLGIHVSNLEPYNLDIINPTWNEITRPAVMLTNKINKGVETILADKTWRVGRPRRDVQEFLVKWRGLPDEEISWEHTEDLKTVVAIIEEFEQRRLKGTSTI